MTDRVKVAVIGVGHLGRIHASLYASMPEVELAGVVDVNAAQAEKVGRELGVPAFTSYQPLLRKVQAVSVAVPTRHHFAVASHCLSNGIAVLVEKPMTGTLEEAQQLVDLSRRQGAILQVGHVERFNPAVVAVKRYLSRPRYIEADRIGPFSFRSTDIGVVLDLMIHDLDIVLDLVPSEVESVEAIGFSVLSTKEDIANARLRFRDGCVANLTASRVSPKTLRKIRLFQRDAYISLDYEARKAQVYRRAPGVETGSVPLVPSDPATADRLRKSLFTKYLNITDVEIDEREPLRMELAAFVKSVRDGTEPVVTGEMGMRAIALAMRILDEIATHQREFEE